MLTAALSDLSAAAALALLPGAGPDGLARSCREIFMRSIRQARAEAQRLLGGTAA